MGYVTKEQIERAKQIDVLEYIKRTEPHNIQRVGKEYRLKDHDSLTVSYGKWYWHSREIGGKTAIGYLTDVRGFSFVDAVCTLLNENPTEKSTIPNVKPMPERKLFSLPLRNKDNKRVIAYLQNRGIERDVILECINRGDLYETQKFHNCCFIGRDENGKARYAALRGTLSSFKCDVDGSDKKFGFVLPPTDIYSRNAAVFESQIDALSHLTLCKNGSIQDFNGWRISLGGSSTLALKQFLKQHPKVTHYIVCTDDDEAGNLAAEKITQISGITTERFSPGIGKDWNDTLMDMQKPARAQNYINSKERS